MSEKTIKSYKGFDKEHWKDIEGFNGNYQISDLGNVRSRLCKNGKGFCDSWHLIKLMPDKDGYRFVTLRNNSKTVYCRVHRLVAKSFIPNPSNYKIVNHKDECKSNNKVENLEWCSSRYNQTYGLANYRRTLKSCKKIGGFKGDSLELSFQSISEAGRNGYHRYSIYLCLYGKQKVHKGLTWKFIE